MLRLIVEIGLGLVLFTVVFVWGWHRFHQHERLAQRAPEEKKEPDALASASRSDFESRRLTKSAAKGFQKRPTDGTAA